MSSPFKTNTLYYGDNLEVMRKYLPNECIDLIYLDPPFNSKADYNILFKESTGEESTAQIQAFSDSWHWDVSAKHAFDNLAIRAPEDISNLITAFYGAIGKNDMLAYLVMMGERLLELHKVLKPTGSIFLHCDPTASHYLKLLLDAIFEPTNFRNEIVWKRIQAHSDALRFGRATDRILFYSKTDDFKFHKQGLPYSEDYLNSKYTHVNENGRKYRLGDLNPPGGRGPVYEFHGLTRPWRFTKEKMLQLEKDGRIYSKSRVPQYIRYLDEQEAKGGAIIPDIWVDISPINSQAKERLGYPTQKPLELLERIINAASDEGDWVLDPFCGCGTAIIASEKLHRRWIGIDITYLAINLIRNRLKDSFPNAVFKIEGEPRDMDGAKALAKTPYQFQWWALSLIEARPSGSTEANPKEGKKGADQAVDGWLKFADGAENHYEKIIVSVKSGHVGVKDIRELRDTISRQNGAMGIFITLEDPTSEMVKEVKVTDPYVSPRWKTEYPRLQILTIEQLLKGEKPNMPQTVNLFQEAPKISRLPNHAETKLD